MNTMVKYLLMIPAILLYSSIAAMFLAAKLGRPTRETTIAFYAGGAFSTLSIFTLILLYAS